MYRFPRTRFVDCNSIKDQIGHCYDEVVETMTAILGNEGPHRAMEECIDAIHSLETLARIIQEKHGVSASIMAGAVEKKNRARGYYAE